MAFQISIHPVDPQPRLVRQAVAAIRDGSVVVYPTDSTYALGCLIGDKDAMERIRRTCPRSPSTPGWTTASTGP
jgi:tRNA A37 threonylcarbamoyladenosine synthetase subunit TsaC/SUA5/YrdC